MIRSIRPGSLLVAGLVLFTASSFAQQFSISGTVNDTQGPSAGVSITLRSLSGSTRQAVTDSEGRYSAEGLGAGTYELSFSKDEFRTERRTVSLTSAAVTLNVNLGLNAVSSSIEVTDVAGKATASRMEVPDSDLPVQVSSIPEDLLKTQGVNDMVTALRNASGVSAQRFYGVYEYYTIRGFNSMDVQLVDGMRMEGNRFNTQLNNVQQVDVLKGPSSILYGSGALGGAINIIRKKPQSTRLYDLSYRTGRWNLQQVAGGAAGSVTQSVLFRVDASFEHNDAWRHAGANRLNVSPTVTWLSIAMPCTSSIIAVRS